MNQKNNLKRNSSALLVFILTIGVLGIINTEMGVVGIFPLIAEMFGASGTQARWTVSAFTLIVALSAPITPILLGVDRKTMILMTLILSSCSDAEKIIISQSEQLAQPDDNPPGEKSMKIKITAGNSIVTATLKNHPTSRDFLSRLPLDVILNDYVGAEKIFYPRPALITDGTPRGNGSSRGYIDLYVPWGNIAIFYKGKGGNSNSIINLGRIDGNGIEALEAAGDISVRIERE